MKKINGMRVEGEAVKTIEDRLFEKYGSRLTLSEVAHELKKSEKLIYKERCANVFPIPMFREKGGRRSPLLADYRAVAKHLEETSASASPTSPGLGGYNAPRSASLSSR